MYFNHNFSGGSILNANWVLTAAHCIDVEGEDLQVVAGEHDFETITGTEQTRAVVQRVIHENWDENEILYDIGVVRIESPFNFVAGIVEVTRLPQINSIHSGYVTLHGWGSISRENDQIYPDILHVKF